MLASIGMVTYNLLTRHGKHRQFLPDNDFPCIHAFRAAIQKLTLATMAHRPPAVQGAEAHVGNPQAEPSLLQRPAQPIVLPRNGAERANCCGFILTLTCNLTPGAPQAPFPATNVRICQKMRINVRKRATFLSDKYAELNVRMAARMNGRFFLQHSCPFF